MSIEEIFKIIYAMVFSSSDKDKFSTYQLNDVDKTWCIQWRDNRSLMGGPVIWEVVKK